jgi:hypothetical protein
MGGRVAASLSRQTSILVASGSKGALSTKAEKARELGTRVMSRDEFEAEFFPPSLWARVVGKEEAKKNERCYMTHDNGGRSFKACFNGQSFWVFKPSSMDDDELVHDAVAVKPTKHTRVFVGRSPRNAMTEFSGGHGPAFDGNSMLFELAPGRYMFVGECIRTFGTKSPITTFVSPVGNNDVPYPFAIDGSGIVYLLTEGVRLTSGPYAKEVLQDPFEFYYARGLLTPDFLRRSKVEPFEGITKFFIGTKRYTLRYEPFPEQDFDRLGGRGKLYVVARGEKTPLSKEDYVGLMCRFGKQRGFAPLRSKLLVPRL